MRFNSLKGRKAPVIAGLMALVLVTACAEASRDPNHIFYYHGEDVILESCEVKREVDTVCKVTNTTSQLNGLEVTIPAGTLNRDNILLISENQGVVDLPFMPGQHRPIIGLKLAEHDEFEKVVSVAVPVLSPDSTYTFFWVEDEKYISVVISDTPRPVSTSKAVVTFLTKHPGLFSWSVGAGK